MRAICVNHLLRLLAHRWCSELARKHHQNGDQHPLRYSILWQSVFDGYPFYNLHYLPRVTFPKKKKKFPMQSTNCKCLQDGLWAGKTAQWEACLTRQSDNRSWFPELTWQSQIQCHVPVTSTLLQQGGRWRRRGTQMSWASWPGVWVLQEDKLEWTGHGGTCL